MFETHDYAEFDDTGLDDRKDLLEHLNFVIFPGCRGWFVDQIVEAIELAAAGEKDAWIEVDTERLQVRNVIEFWQLEAYVTAAKAGDFKPRGGDESWRCEAPRPVEAFDDTSQDD
jgi:hypothetical protein